MGKPHPIELRERVVAFVEEGHSHRAAAGLFSVSPRFVNDMVKLRRETGALIPKRQGNPGRGKLTPYGAWVRQRLADQGDLTLDALRLELQDQHGVRVHRGSIGHWLHRLGLSHKKTLIASERKRADIRVARHLWIDRRLPFLRRALHRLVFLNETSTNTKLTKRTGWAPLGERLYDHSPFGHWQTQTFIAALRCHGLTAPWIINAPMNKQIFNLYVETQLAPTLSKGDVVIMDNLASHKSSTAQEPIRGQGAWTLFLPPIRPTSTRSRWPSQKSRPSYEKPPHVPIIRFGSHWLKSANSFRQTNV